MKAPQCKSRLIVDRLGLEFACCQGRVGHDGPHTNDYLGRKEWLDGDWSHPSFYQGELESTFLALRYVCHELAKANRRARADRDTIAELRRGIHNALDAVHRATQHLRRNET